MRVARTINSSHQRIPSCLQSYLPPSTFCSIIHTLSSIAVAMSSSTTPIQSSSAQRSASRNRRPSSRPTTPLRPSSRSSLRESHTSAARIGVGDPSQFPLESLEPAFAELSDSMADLETNFEHLQSMHESLSRFTESFASFLYGLNMNAFCVDFPEVICAY